MLCTCNNLLLLLGLLNKSPEGNQLVKRKEEFLTPMGDGGDLWSSEDPAL